MVTTAPHAQLAGLIAERDKLSHSIDVLRVAINRKPVNSIGVTSPELRQTVVKFLAGEEARLAVIDSRIGDLASRSPMLI
jgi:hypothetical protein